MNTDQFEEFLDEGCIEVIRVHAPVYEYEGKTYDACSRGLSSPESFLNVMNELGVKRVFLLEFFPVVTEAGNHFIFRGNWE